MRGKEKGRGRGYGVGASRYQPKQRNSSIDHESPSQTKNGRYSSARTSPLSRSPTYHDSKSPYYDNGKVWKVKNAPEEEIAYKNIAIRNPAEDAYNAGHLLSQSPPRQYSPRTRIGTSPQLEHVSVGRVYNVTLTEYTERGMKVVFNELRSGSPHAEKSSDLVNVVGFLPWSVFSKKTHTPENSFQRNIEKKLPRGSKFNVFVNSIEENEMFLTLATRPALVLNYEPSPLPMTSTCSPYRYLVIMDLEATCDFSPRPVVDSTTAEIIEFPWVVMDTQSLELIYKKQLYIRPDNLRGITPYCITLTGITEEEVSEGCTLKDALAEFNEYVNSLPDSFCLLTDGVWDIQVQLRSEAQRKRIFLEKYFNQYFDLKAEFRKYLDFFPWKNTEPALHTMLQALNLSFVGKHHAGIDDCHTIAQIVTVMIQQGHCFEKPSVVPAGYSFHEDPSFVGFSSLAPEDSWKCEVCTDRCLNMLSFTDDEYLAVWNPPLASTCRFCSNVRPYDFHEARKCFICGIDFVLTQEEVEFYRSKKWFYPRNCGTCRSIKV